MQLSFDFDVDPLDVASQLPRMVDMWRVEARIVLEEWGQELTAIAKELSPSDPLRGEDKRRRPENESFKQFWDFQTGFDGQDPFIEVGNTDERMPYIVFPTEPRQEYITPVTKDHLTFFWIGHGGWTSKDFVKRKPTPGQPVHEWTIEEFNIDQHLPDLVR